NPAMADRAFFYFRDPAYADSLPHEVRKDFISQDAESSEKLRTLKDRIRQSHRAGQLKYPPRENYGDVQALGKLVRGDFTALLEAFPNWLYMAAARLTKPGTPARTAWWRKVVGRQTKPDTPNGLCQIILVLDALDKLQDQDGALNLLWLPTSMPADVKLIV